MGIYRLGFAFSTQFPPGEEILAEVFKRHQIKIRLTIDGATSKPPPPTNTASDYFYSLTHPKDKGVGWLRRSRYRAVGLLKLEYEGQKLMMLVTSPGQSDVMDMVAEALQSLGGVEERV